MVRESTGAQQVLQVMYKALQLKNFCGRTELRKNFHKGGFFIKQKPSRLENRKFSLKSYDAKSMISRIFAPRKCASGAALQLKKIFFVKSFKSS